MTTREKIAKLKVTTPADNPVQFVGTDLADAILAIPEIKEGRELWEKRDRLVELDADQTTPHAISLPGTKVRRVKVKG